MAENTFVSRIETLEEKVMRLETTIAKLLKELNKLKKANASTVEKKSEVVELPVEKKKRTTKKKSTVKE